MEPLPTDKLRQRCDPSTLPFKSTRELTEQSELVGQRRALDAIRLSAQISHRDFNLFVLGPNGTGRHTAIMKLLRDEAENRETPQDWVYVNNFEAAHKPKALCLPPGTALRLKQTMQHLIDDLGNEIPALFDSEEYQVQYRAFEQELGEAQEEAMADFSDRAQAENVALLRTPMGFMLTAIRDGKLFYDADGVGGAGKVLIAELDSGLILTANDFFVF